MTRRPFGGGGDAVVLSFVTGKPVPFATGTAWTDRSGGSLITDVADLAGVSLPSSQLLTDAAGAIPPFLGPADGTGQMWVDFGNGRYLLTATDLEDRVEDIEGNANSGAGFTLLAARGDLIVATADDTPIRLPIGTSGQVLTADPTQAAGMRWASVAEAVPDTTSSINLTLTAAGAVAVPSGNPVSGNVLKVKAVASGANRDLVFDAAFRLTGAVTSRTVTILSGQTLLAEAEYSALAGGWVLTRAIQTTDTPPSGGGTGGGGVGGTLSAGADASMAAGGTFSRTATEPTGVTITSRAWTIVSGPLGTGTTIGTAAALSWVPGSSPSNTVDIRQPVCQEMAYELVSTAENSTVDWTTAYNYIQDIGDDRGYTGGLVGFTSATGDMLALVQYYGTLKPSGNTLTPYLTGLQNCANIGMGSGASAAAASNLGSAYQTAWAAAANTDPIFRRAQRDLRKSMYWDDALAQALADGVGPLGLALHYDVLVNHGPGTDAESYGGIIAAARASSSKPPSAGGNEKNYLTKICDLRDAVLQGWGDYQADGRSGIYRGLLTANKLTLLTPFTWNVYGDPYTMSVRPTPPTDAVIGTYVIKYTATGAGTDNVQVTVT